MTEEIEQLLKNLKLGRMRSIYDEQLRAAEKQQVSYSEFVAALLRAQWHHRQESALEWRIAAPISQSVGRWRPSRTIDNPASSASRSRPWPNSTSWPNTRIWF